MMINTTQELIIALEEGTLDEITMNKDCNALKGKITSYEADMILSRLSRLSLSDKKIKEIVRFITRFTNLEDDVIKKHYKIFDHISLTHLFIKSDITDRDLFEQICKDTRYCSHMWRYKYLDLELVKKYECYINFKMLSQNVNVPEDVIRYYDSVEDIDWYGYSFKENLSEDFVTYYKDKLCLGALIISNPSLIGILQLKGVFSYEEIHKYRELQKECNNDEKLYKQQLFAIEMLEGRRDIFCTRGKYNIETTAKYQTLVDSIVEKYFELFNKEALHNLYKYQLFLSDGLRAKIKERI